MTAMANKHGHWREPSRGEHFMRCDYCGSMRVEDLLDEIDNHGARLEPTDWKYGWPHKFYVHVYNREPDRLYVIGTAHTPRDAGLQPPTGYTIETGLTPEQRMIVEAEGYGTEASDTHIKSYMFGKRGQHFAKFYTEHLLDGTPEMLAAFNIKLGHVEFFFVEPGGVANEGTPRQLRNESGKRQLYWRERTPGPLTGTP